VRLRTVLSVFAIASGVVCAEFLIQPGFWITLYGASPDAQARFLYRLLAALFGGLGVMAWSGRTAEPSPARRAMIRGLVAATALIGMLAVSAAVTGVYNAFAWAPAVSFLWFAAALFRADFTERRSSLTRRTALASRF
jgi:hypothetical protein